MKSNIKIKSILSIGTLCILFSCSAQIKKEVETKAKIAKQPNIIYILADDLGYADLSVYGQQKINTPNIDQLAKNGMLFTQHYAGSAVCAPSRSSLMSGQHTGKTSIRNNSKAPNVDEGQPPMSAETITVAEILKSKGYATGAFGKWGLGYVGSEGDPNNQGFDEFFGYNCQTYAHRFYPTHLWQNREKFILKGNDWKNKVTYSADVIHEKALGFLEKNKNNPFFLYYPSTLPHAELVVPEDKLFKQQKEKFGKEVPYVGKKNDKGLDYDDNLVIKEYATQKNPHAAYAAMVLRLDRHVGEIMAKVKELGLEENTIIVFSSDNGPHAEGGGDPEFFNSNGIFKGIKRDLYEGGIREPMIVQWPSVVKAGSTTNHVSAFWDVLATVADIVNVHAPKESQGISFLPTLLGKPQKEHEYLYWEFHEKKGRQAVRTGDWKGVRLEMTNNPNAPIELYDLSIDPGEKNNIAAKYPEIVKKIDRYMKEAHQESDRYKFEFEIKK
ncbi:arylsulfatase [Polaribacter sp. BAL334]|uniref:arylsulfatase n=1 Tax=Polaribacter sp. BAL334 TaxID=1708178 RepID=UPI0018D220ED|nr:arylsulfatase [Polaribacter sp. BAL334]MBG7613127.1 arylsulfatase [Polaribacter sp. BAL334]